MPPIQSPPNTSEQLFHLSLNDDKPRTILLLHGLMSSHREWAKITPSLSEYHLLIPDLPGHRSSDHLGPFTLSNASELVARLIRAYAHNSQCHVAGFSGGGFVAVELANRHPELVQSLFISGVVSSLEPVLPRLWPDA
jgi:pimeloyl-ACP methyl ester carboxylesterase